MERYDAIGCGKAIDTETSNAVANFNEAFRQLND